MANIRIIHVYPCEIQTKILYLAYNIFVLFVVCGICVILSVSMCVSVYVYIYNVYVYVHTHTHTMLLLLLLLLNIHMNINLTAQWEVNLRLPVCHTSAFTTGLCLRQFAILKS